MGESDPLLGGKVEMAPPTFTQAIPSSTGRSKKPQAIAHRGYKAAYPENTMGAFRGAVEVGAHAIETDLHVSKDGVVVLSHDPTLKRCFGVDKKIIDCDWSYLKTLRTLKEPHSQLPRLTDLLEYLATPGLEDIWLLLDIKVPIPRLMDGLKRDRADRWAKLDESVEETFRLIAAALADTKPSRSWQERVLLGCWGARHVPFCTKHLPGYSITHIGFSTVYARQFLKIPGASFNMLQILMVGPLGNAFVRDVKEAKRSIFLWTVNKESWMKWSIRKEVDGVVTDDPKKFLEVCDNYQGEKDNVTLSSLPMLIFINAMHVLFLIFVRYTYIFNTSTVEV